MVIEASCSCGFAGEIDQFPIKNEQYTCPKCNADESAIATISLDDGPKQCKNCSGSIFMDADTQTYEHHERWSTDYLACQGAELANG